VKSGCGEISALHTMGSVAHSASPVAQSSADVLPRCVGECSTSSTSTVTPGTILMGGGTDTDQAYTHLIKWSGNGDVLVIRASGTDAYNP
jgi:hypothetical protein